MFDTWEGEVDEVGTPTDSTSLRRALELHDRLTAQITIGLAGFDRDQGYELDGAISLRGWLTHTGLAGPAAGRFARNAKNLARLPLLSTAWADGRITGGQIDAIVARLNPRRLPVLEAREDVVVDALTGADVNETVRFMGEWAERVDAVLDDEVPLEPPDSLHSSTTLDGRREVHGSFGLEGGEIVDAALALARTPDDPDRPRTLAQRNADALLDLCRDYLDHRIDAPGPRQRPHVSFVWDAERYEAGLGMTTVNGAPLDRVTSERLLCDCSLTRVVRSRKGQILDYGVTIRNPPAHLRNAVMVRDRGCRWPGCGRPPRHCDAHHVVWFTKQGPTAISNLAALCIRHHHLLHRPGWSAVLDPDTAELTITAPDGRTLTSRPPPAATAA